MFANGTPEYRELATLPDAERYIAEADITRRLRKKHQLFNILDGRNHTDVTRRKISAGNRRAWAEGRRRNATG
ncbi:MAG: hypothetical protein ACRDOL_30245 [Streptosporangiaceae bacterium]